MFGLPNLDCEDLVRRMEVVAESMADSASRTEGAAELMLQAAEITNPERTEQR
jgi:hypothetical protein